MASKMVTPPTGGAANQVLTKTSSTNGAVAWRDIYQPKELWVALNGNDWYGGLSTAPSFYVMYLYQDGKYHMYMTGANSMVDQIGSSKGKAASSSDYYYVLFTYGGTSGSSQTRVPVIVKLNYQGCVQPINGYYPIPVEAVSGHRCYLYGGQIIGKA